ncbi:nitrile hydratase subunit beta [Modestobacter sp. I12A-02628]|uniref:Nitrile hydratase subunit beta n=1 Tax=Goekera deserti TaxID=2497753 RepID=A0A7K3WCG2_9ACTN|nr:SH3-like domain-containing protein [Goekera deserti]MPQ98505.1 nitrile hydratase subunit beta [Goekera deserti]NDI48335.1 nitrile hydratase subunit beta [Goekera deserti]NEL54084.1 nitrile hydratase subunit beta [Goekera deserti]
MADRFVPGDRVRTRSVDPAGHTRLPRYARGALGTVVERAGVHPLADDRARGLPGAAEPVWHVRFEATELFGTGDHAVTVEVWDSYLEAVS